MDESPALVDERLAAVLPAGSLFAVGGRVRDEVRSELDGVARIAKDLDYVVVGIDFDELVARIRTAGSANVVGASFAVVKATIDGVTADVALPRRERSTGVGHREFAVEAGPAVTLADDLGRRDFRMNMLARALPDGALVDPYGGRDDVAARRIDLLRDEAFAEDPLRMLRACQFAARFEYTVSARTRAAMCAAAPLVTSVSLQRIRDELTKLVALALRPSLGFELMRETGLLAFVLPEVAEGVGVEQNVYHAYDVYEHNLRSLDATAPGDLVLRLATLLHDVGKPRTKDGPHFYGHETVGAEMTRDALERLQFPQDDIGRVANLIRNHMYATNPEQKDAAVRRFARRVGIEELPRQFALRQADIAGSGLPKRDDENERFARRVFEVLARQPPLSEHELVLGGREVIAALVRAGKLAPGSRGGPLVGVVLRQLLEAVIEEPELNTATALGQRLETLVADLPG